MILKAIGFITLASIAMQGQQSQDKTDLATIKVEVLKQGKGHPATPGDICYMEYTGTLLNGKVFDSNANGKREPFAFTLGAGQVIRGWDLGVAGMKPGEERRLTIPSALAYGEQAIGDIIPANSTMVFTVKLFDTVRPGEEALHHIIKRTDGRGPKAKKGDQVAFDLDVKLLNGTTVFSTKAETKTLTAIVGDEASPYSRGLMTVLEGVRPGTKMEVNLPPMIAQGTESKGASNQLLKYHIHVLSVESKN